MQNWSSSYKIESEKDKYNKHHAIFGKQLHFDVISEKV